MLERDSKVSQMQPRISLSAYSLKAEFYLLVNRTTKVIARAAKLIVMFTTTNIIANLRVCSKAWMRLSIFCSSIMSPYYIPFTVMSRFRALM